MIDIERLEQSKDPRLRRFLVEVLELLSSSTLAHAAFGSCAAFAYQGRVRRLTRDLDVVMPQADLDRLAEIAVGRGFKAMQERRNFVRIHRDIFQLHAVSEAFQLFDYRTRELISPMDLSIDWPEVETRPLRFITKAGSLDLPVVPLETTLSVSIMRPLNSNSIDDVSGLLTTREFDAAGMAAFTRRNPALRSLILAQLDRLESLVRAAEPVRDGLYEAIDCARAAVGEGAPEGNILAEDETCRA